MLNSDGFGTGPTPWRAVQVAAWEALRARSEHADERVMGMPYRVAGTDRLRDEGAR